MLRTMRPSSTSPRASWTASWRKAKNLSFKTPRQRSTHTETSRTSSRRLTKRQSRPGAHGTEALQLASGPKGSLKDKCQELCSEERSTVETKPRS
ncbi:hypothetical protein J4Q44_G00343720 [Coregonus suidteri]|uniref:Uncharacterized protein n=1 Tax=Coregonus suidteri TaxID=861788 RepID=A0AAN8QCW6_9TELE